MKLSNKCSFVSAASWNINLEMRDIVFIAGNFLEAELPREKQYLFRYFRKPVRRKYLCYYHVFGNDVFFAEHTGFRCSIRSRQLMRKKLATLERVHKEAVAAMDFDLLSKIEKGKYKCPKY